MIRISAFKVENKNFNGYKRNVGTNKNEKQQSVLTPQIRECGAINRGLISFSGLEFYQTLNENYFQLPNGAKPDKYQKKAAQHIFEGDDVLVTAPTGTGKTAIAYYAISKNMEDGKRTFYTTPLKALSNEKFKQLRQLFGDENVGLLTGDVKINSKAPIVVMTTEIYRNMVFSDKIKNNYADNLENLKTVIFDELHYIGDVDRGGTWEQSIILSDKDTQFLSLSATIGNHKDINNWISKTKGKQAVNIDVPPENRHVPLEFKNFDATPVRKKSSDSVNSSSNEDAKEPQPDMKSYFKLVENLRNEDKLPAIFFVFSKNYSKKLLNAFLENGPQLIDKQERFEIKELINKYKRSGKYLGETLNYEALLKGYAVHNSGLLPSQKEFIEELFQKKLIKVVFATETLAAGINMPARTTVISATRKPTSRQNSSDIDCKIELRPNEFHQMGGRAGRRGIDTKGYVYTMFASPEQKQTFNKLIQSKPNDVHSSFKPEYSFIAGYYKNTNNDDVVKEIFKNSLFAYDENPDISNNKSNELLAMFEDKKEALNKLGYIDSDNNLTEKGQLLSGLSGYVQIPIIDTIHAKKLSCLTPAELAGCIGSLANMSDKNSTLEDDTLEKAVFKSESPSLSYFINDLSNYMDDYNTNMQFDSGDISFLENQNAAKHLYEWAKLCQNDEMGRFNWKKLFDKFSDEKNLSEGSLFKEITQTVDLLKQIVKISDIAIKNDWSKTDNIYYSELKQTAQEAIELLQQEPIASELTQRSEE